MAKIAYITRINFFSDRANVHTIAKTCEAISQTDGVNLDLVSVDNSLMRDEEKSKFFAEHDVNHRFTIISLNSFANQYKTCSNFLGYGLGIFLANLSLSGYLWRQRKNIDLVYFRDHFILPVILFSKYILGKKIVYESHYILTKQFGQWLTEYCVSVSDGVVAITVALKNYYQKLNKNIIVAFCASSEKEKFKTDLPNSYFKEKIGLSLEKFYLIYTGNIDLTGNGDSYGVEDIVRALPYLSEDVCFVAVGKKTKGLHNLEKLSESLKVSDRFKCLPWVLREKITDYILAADVLIIPKSGAGPGNSPTKMFEYLGTGRPIVAADTLPIREVLHDKINALLVDYSDPQAWAEAVNLLVKHSEFREKIVHQAMEDADLYTWKTRGSSISSFIKKFYV